MSNIIKVESKVQDLAIFQNAAVNLYEEHQAQILDVLLNNANTLLLLLDVRQSTIQTYQDSIKPFVQYLDENGINLVSFKNYKKHLAGELSIGTSTKIKRFIAAKSLLKVAFQNGIIPTDITLNVKGFTKTVEHKKDGLNEVEVNKVKAYIDGMKDGCKKNRIGAMFALLAFQGLRTFEVLNLQVSDINIGQSTIKVLGKGRDDKQVVDLHPMTKEALSDYLSCCGIKSGYLFTSTYLGEVNQMKRRAFIKLWTNDKNGIFKKAGVDASKTVHGLRHFFVTSVLNFVNGDLLRAMKYTRHKSISQLKVYDDRREHKKTISIYYDYFSTLID